MSEKELLCVALVTENGERYNAEIYQDGTYLARDGSYLRLTELEFEHAKVLTRRAEREKRLVQDAKEIVPYRKGDMPPEEYIEDIAPYSEEDYLLPEERTLPEDMVEPDKEPDALAQVKDVEVKVSFTDAAPTDTPKGNDLKNDEEEQKLSAKEQKRIDAQKKKLAKQAKRQREKDEKAAVKAEKNRQKELQAEINKNNKQLDTEEIYVDEDAARQMMEAPKKKKIPVIPIIIVAILLGIAGFYFGYVSGGFNLEMLPGIISGQTNEPPAEPTPGPVTTAAPDPTPEATQAPPKTEINLIIDATDGAQVSGSTDVGTNEDDNAVSTTAMPETQNDVTNTGEG